MDEADYSAAEKAAARNEAIARARAAGPAKILARCQDCGRRIPAMRRLMCRRLGLPCTRCLPCQGLFEERSQR
jgi:hypothetical protein